LDGSEIGRLLEGSEIGRHRQTHKVSES
jgi:hypothetical protein